MFPKVVLMQVEIEPAPEWADRLQMYALLAPHIGGGGWGNSAHYSRLAALEVRVV